MGGQREREFAVVKIGKVRTVQQIALAECTPSSSLPQFICCFVLCISRQSLHKTNTSTSVSEIYLIFNFIV